MTVGMCGSCARCVGHDGMLGIFILGGAGAYDILGGREAVGTLGGGGAVGTVTLGGRAGRLYQRVIGGVVGIAGLGTGRANFIIFDDCISACVCSLPIFAVGEAGCWCWSAAISFWMERVIFSCGETPGRTLSWGKKRTVSPWQTRCVSEHQISKQR